MKLKTVLFGAILWTEASAFSPSIPLTSLRNTNTRSEHNRISYENSHLSRQYRLHAWSPFKNKEPTETAAPDQIETPLEPGPLDAKNAGALAIWVSLIIYAYLFAPGEWGATADSEMINMLISQPTPRPESINELWFVVWNLFAVVPAVIAALTAPTGRGQRLPAAPFLWGSAAFGYFALGPYYMTRTVRSDPVDPDELGWASRNIFENRLFGALLAALTISIPFSADVFAPGFDFGAALAGLVDLQSGSRFVAVATADIVIMSIISAVLAGEDCRRRGGEDKANLITVGSLLFPVLGPTLYLVARPSLEE